MNVPGVAHEVAWKALEILTAGTLEEVRKYAIGLVTNPDLCRGLLTRFAELSNEQKLIIAQKVALHITWRLGLEFPWMDFTFYLWLCHHEGTTSGTHWPVAGDAAYFFYRAVLAELDIAQSPTWKEEGIPIFMGPDGLPRRKPGETAEAWYWREFYEDWQRENDIHDQKMHTYKRAFDENKRAFDEERRAFDEKRREWAGAFDEKRRIFADEKRAYEEGAHERRERMHACGEKMRKHYTIWERFATAPIRVAFATRLVAKRIFLWLSASIQSLFGVKTRNGEASDGTNGNTNAPGDGGNPHGADWHAAPASNQGEM
jgi:hypothetical protein